VTPYRAPIEDIRVAFEVADSQFEGRQDSVDWKEVEPVLAGCGRFAEEIYAPLNAIGDREGCRFEKGAVSAPKGFKEAYQSYAQAGWGAVGAPENFGGQGLPFKVAIAVAEMLNAANLSLAMGSMPTPGAIELLKRFGTKAQRQFYLPRVISGEWTVTMAMTEPQAGSDLGAIKAHAVINQGEIFLKGQKSLITWGEHNLTEDILHLVLARSPNGPSGTKGLSLYLVSKRDSNGRTNGVACTGIENKMGLRGSPTASLSFGEDAGTKAELLGEENRGLEQMFVLLNQARLRVAAFGLGSAERSLQAAQAYASSRVQGRGADGKPTTIENHPDVQRMLTSMDARTQSIRLIIQYVAALVDRATGEDASALEAQTKIEILTPIAKAWCTEMAFDVTSTGVQVFGGIGYSEDCEASLYFREARVHMIYEGTTGIQASDLIFRKIRRDGGEGFARLLSLITAELAKIESQNGLRPSLVRLRRAIGSLADLCRSSILRKDADQASLQANAASFLMFAGAIIASWLSVAAAVKANSTADGGAQAERRVRNANYMIDQCLAPAEALAQSVLANERIDDAGERACA
jgi:alkylation response protein AidB-like acyl-CoA dehydrogenase